MITRFFSFLVFCLMLVACGNVYGADATCVRAWTFYPANGRGVADKSNGPVVIRVEVQGAYASARERANTEFTATVVAWQNKTGKNKAVVPLLRVLSVGAPTYSDVQSFCWHDDNRFAKQYRSIVDSWPRATFPANPRAGLAKQIAPTIPVAAIDYLPDESGRWRWVAVPNKANLPLYTCDVSLHYKQLPPGEGATVDGQSLSRSKPHVLGSGDGSAENAKTAMRRWARDELRKTMNGLPWQESDISATCKKSNGGLAR